MEPSPTRDNGPYPTRLAAASQVEAITHGIPCDDQMKVEIAIREALLICGVELSGYEEIFVAHIGALLQPAAAQVFCGWIIRAHLTGKAR
jgi:hypothetical protein